jgi:hypothetical protein
VQAVSGPIEIPVVFHIVVHPDSVAAYNTMGISNQSFFEAVIEDQLTTLNQGFNGGLPNTSITSDPWELNLLDGLSANAEITFKLAKTDPEGVPTTGIEYREIDREFRVEVSDGKFNHSDVYSAAISNRGLAPWDKTRYLNVWVVSMTSFVQGREVSNQALAGFGIYPWGIGENARKYEGVYVNANPKFFGAGRGTLIHEIGHYLGLLHPWGENNSCFTHDCVDDTPPQKGPSDRPDSGVCHPFPYLAGETVCLQTIDVSTGQLFMNFMDYVPDACMTLFTQGQVDRMRRFLAPSNSFLYRPRYGLIDPSNSALIPCGGNSPVGEPNNTLSTASDSLLAFSNSSSGGVTRSGTLSEAVATCDPVDYYRVRLASPGIMTFAYSDPLNAFDIVLLDAVGNVIEAARVSENESRVLTICRDDPDPSVFLDAFLMIRAKEEGTFPYRIWLRWEPNASCENPTPVSPPGAGGGLTTSLSQPVACANLPEVIQVSVSGGTGQCKLLGADGTLLNEGDCANSLSAWSPQHPGDYTYTVIDEEGQFGSAILSVVESPTIDPIPLPLAPTQGTVSFSMHVSGGTPPYSYLWIPPIEDIYNTAAPVAGGSSTDTAVSYLLSGAAWLDPQEVIATATDAYGCKVAEYTGYNQPPNNGPVFYVSGYTATEDNPIVLNPGSGWNFSLTTSGFDYEQIDGSTMHVFSSVTSSWSNEKCHIVKLIGGRSAKLCWVKSVVGPDSISVSLPLGQAFMVDATTSGNAQDGVKYFYEWSPKRGVTDPFSLQASISPPTLDYDHYVLTVTDNLGGTKRMGVGIIFTPPPAASNLTFGEASSVVFRQQVGEQGELHALSHSSEAITSDKLVFSGDIRNAGTMPTLSDAAYVIELTSEDTTIVVTQAQIPAGLTPGQSYPILDSLALTNLPPGVYGVQGHVDLGDRENQQYAIDDVWLDENGQIFAFPDLIADSLSLNQDSIVLGSTVSLSGLTGNAGPLNMTGSYTVRVWVSEDADLHSEDSLVSEFLVSGPLRQGEGFPFTADWVVPNAHEDSLLFFLVEVDAGDAYEEVSELNLFPVPFWIGEDFASALEGEELPSPLTLFPNPSTGHIHLEYDAARPGTHTLQVFSMTGQRVATQTYTATSPGPQQIIFDGRLLPAGVYTFQLDTPALLHAKAVILSH